MVDIINQQSIIYNNCPSKYYLQRISKPMDAQQKFQLYNEHHLQKTCKICNTDNCQQFQFIFCDECDDGYHCKCLTPPIPDQQVEDIPIWLCPQCRQLQPNQRSNSLHVLESICYKCGQQLKKQTIHEVGVEYIDELGQKSNRCMLEIQKLVKCRLCQHQFHPACFSHRLNSLNCWKCEKSIRQNSPKCNEQFIAFIKEDVQQYKKIGYFQVEPLEPQIQGQYQRLEKMDLSIFPLVTNWELICRMQMSLYYALQTNHVHYCRTQLYLSKQSMGLNHSNKNLVQPSKLHQSDQKIYEIYRQYTINYYLPPLQVRQDRAKGFYVVALQYIPKKSLLCEYAGEVLTRKESNKNYKQNDSIMSLIVSNFADNSLDIIPVKFSNVSRFILGIPPNRKDLQNVQTLNFCYEGRSHIIFFSTSNIEKGDILYIDYNDGIFEEYPTENFII